MDSQDTFNFAVLVRLLLRFSQLVQISKLKKYFCNLGILEIPETPLEE